MKRNYSDPKFRGLEIRHRVALVEDTDIFLVKKGKKSLKL